MHRTKYFAPLPGGVAPLTARELFDRNECRVITKTPRPRFPRRVALVERIRQAWAAFRRPVPR